MRLLRRMSVLTALLGLMLLPAGRAQAVPQHLHCISTPSGNTHSIARGVTFMAPHDTAFHNLHGNVHLGAFVTNPNQISADLVAPFSCPPA